MAKIYWAHFEGKLIFKIRNPLQPNGLQVLKV